MNIYLVQEGQQKFFIKSTNPPTEEAQLISKKVDGAWEDVFEGLGYWPRMILGKFKENTTLKKTQVVESY